MTKPACGPAQTLLIEDALKKIIYRDGSRSIKVEKQKGISCLGSWFLEGKYEVLFDKNCQV